MARLSQPTPNFADFLTIGEAAEVLGVSTATLRNWDRSGKLKPRRHPQNGYRIYLHEDLDSLLRSAEFPAQNDESVTSHVNWSKAGPGDHYIQFYESQEFYADAVGRFVCTALERGDFGVLVATSEHRLLVVRKLEVLGIDVIAAERDGHFFLRDAEAIVSEIMVNGELDRAKFANMVTSVVGNLAESGRRIFATGEIAGLLWENGQRAAAIEVEQFWDDFGKRNRMTILCTYPLGKCADSNSQAELAEVCTCHSRVVPAESYELGGDENARLQLVALLQHKARALEAEILHRQEIEDALQKADRHRSQLVNELSQNLRVPLESLRVALEQLKLDSTDEAALAAATNTIACQVDRVGQLVEGLDGHAHCDSDRIE